MTGDRAVLRPARALDAAALRRLFLFEALDDAQLARLRAAGSTADVSPGWLYVQGEPAETFAVLVEGRIAMHRRVGSEDVEFVRTDQVGVYAGAWEAFLGERAPGTYSSSVRVLAPSRLFLLPAPELGAVVAEWFPMAVHLLSGLYSGMTAQHDVVGVRERLLALGTLTAGLTHELGNPAAALARTLAVVRESADRATAELLRPAPHGPAFTRARAAASAAVRPGRQGPAGTGATAGTAGWLAATDLGSARPDVDLEELAESLAELGLDAATLDRAVAAGDPVPAGDLVPWLAAALDVDALVQEAAAASRRISALLAAAGQYAQLDRAPERWADVHELLESSLRMLGNGAGRRPGDGVRITRDYAPDVPEVLAHPGELAQVWTNLLDNAVDAVTQRPAGRGTVHVRARFDPAAAGGGAVVVEVADDGPGIPPELRGRVFDPFVTTKDTGSGTGLGLDIAWRIVVDRHGGDLAVDSRPGRTVFTVRLPVRRGPGIPAR